MPTVPIFKPNTNLAGVPGVRQQDSASPETFGAGIGQATTRVGGELAQMGGELSQLGAQIQQRQDSVAAKDAYQKASEQVLTLMHDPQNGILSKRGSQARGLTNQATKELERIQGEVTKSLTPAQRTLFNSFWDGTRQSSVVSAARHEADQIRVTEDQTNDAIIDNAAAAVAANAYDPKTIQHHIDVGLGTLASKYRGSSEDVYQNAVLEFKTKAYAGAISARMEKDPAGAAAMLKAHESEMDSRLLEKLRAQVEHQDAMSFAQKTGDELMMKYPNPDDEEKAMSQVRDMGLDPTKRQLVETRVQAMFADKRRFQQEKLQARVEQVTGTVFAAPNMTSGRQIVDGITDLKVRAQAEQAFRIRFAEDLQVQAQARSIALSEAAAKRAEGRQEARQEKLDQKFAGYQQVYESLVNFAGNDPTKMVDIIRKQYSGADEENLVRYALGRMQEEKPRAPKLTLRDQVIREGAQQQTISMVRARIDQALAAGQQVTPAQILSWVTAPEFTASDGSPMIDKSGVDGLSKYAAGRGKYGEIKQSQVESILKNLDTQNKKWGLEKFPGLYDMVLERVPPGAKPTDSDLENIVKRLVIQKGTVPGMLWGRNTATAYQALRSGQVAQFDVDVDPKDKVFFQNFMSVLPTAVPGYNSMKVTPEMTQEFIDQVTAPDLNMGRPWAIPEAQGISRPAVYRFYSWVKQNYPNTFEDGKLNTPANIAQLFNIYRSTLNAAGK